MRAAVLVSVLILAVVGLAYLPGCSKPAAIDGGIVHGEVTFQGRPLAGGLIIFVPDTERGCTGKMLTANIASDGQYRLADGAKSVTPGWYKVALADPTEWYGSEWDLAFPAQLRRPDLSGLEREVKVGQDHTFDFKIELIAQ